MDDLFESSIFVRKSAKILECIEVKKDKKLSKKRIKLI